MPAILATFAAPSPTAATMTADARAILVTGVFDRGTLLIEISDNGTDYGLALAVAGEVNNVASSGGGTGFVCPLGWRTRVTLRNAGPLANLRVFVE